MASKGDIDVVISASEIISVVDR